MAKQHLVARNCVCDRPSGAAFCKTYYIPVVTVSANVVSCDRFDGQFMRQSKRACLVHARQHKRVCREAAHAARVRCPIVCALVFAAYGVVRTLVRDSNDNIRSAAQNTFLSSDGEVSKSIPANTSSAELLQVDCSPLTSHRAPCSYPNTPPGSLVFNIVLRHANITLLTHRSLKGTDAYALARPRTRQYNCSIRACIQRSVCMGLRPCRAAIERLRNHSLNMRASH